MKNSAKKRFLIAVMLITCFFSGCGENMRLAQQEEKLSQMEEKALIVYGSPEMEPIDESAFDDLKADAFTNDTNIMGETEEDMPEAYTDWVTLEELTLSYDIFVGLMISTSNLHSECFWDYGILKETGTDTWTLANVEYTNLCRESCGINYEYISEDTREADERRLEREAEYKIVDISEDGESVLVWQKDNWGSEVRLAIYNNNQKIKELVSDELYMAMFFTCGQRFGLMAGWGKYHDLISGESLKLSEKKLENSQVWINGTGEIGAVTDWEEKGKILIFDIKNQQQLYEFDLCSEYCGRDEFGIQISQLKGNAESGKVMFYNSTSAYALSYPEGRVEKLGDYMYHGSYSPDERYFIYTSPDEGILLSAGQDTLYDIPKGIYVKNLETQKTAFVPIERSNHDFGIEEVYIRWSEK